MHKTNKKMVQLNIKIEISSVSFSEFLKNNQNGYRYIDYT